MGFFSKLFEKKVCSICGGEIGLLGNRKLEDGNLCKNCANKLSPWFTERRESTVEEIGAQLKYREENQAAVAAFGVSRTLGTYYKVLVDEQAGKFLVTSASDWRKENPDVLALSAVTGCDLDVRESRSEEKETRKKEDGTTERVSFTPPHYTYSYDFYVKLYVNHPYFDEMSFKLNSGSVDIKTVGVIGSAPAAPAGSGILGALAGAIAGKAVDPRANHAEYQKYLAMGQEIKALLLGIKETPAEQPTAEQPAAKTVVCPYCGATTADNGSHTCAFCGAPLA